MITFPSLLTTEIFGSVSWAKIFPFMATQHTNKIEMNLSILDKRGIDKKMMAAKIMTMLNRQKTKVPDCSDRLPCKPPVWMHTILLPRAKISLRMQSIAANIIFAVYTKSVGSVCF